MKPYTGHCDRGHAHGGHLSFLSPSRPSSTRTKSGRFTPEIHCAFYSLIFLPNLLSCQKLVLKTVVKNNRDKIVAHEPAWKREKNLYRIPNKTFCFASVIKKLFFFSGCRTYLSTRQLWIIKQNPKYLRHEILSWMSGLLICPSLIIHKNLCLIKVTLYIPQCRRWGLL